MSGPYERFAPRIQATADAAGRRALLAEIGLWRASRLTDIPALRDAAYAMATLHLALGEHDAAVHEARALLSLCNTPPAAGDDEVAHARALATSLGEKVPPLRAKKKPQRDAVPFHKAREALADQAWETALRLLGGGQGPQVDLLRTYAYLGRALSVEDGHARDAALRDLQHRMRKHLNLGLPKPPTAPVARPLSEADKKLAALLGVAEVPRGRDARVTMLEAHLAKHPDQADDLAVAALEHHVASEGLKASAPWLFGLVARAMATGPAFRTRKALDALKAQGAFAVSAYDEWPFTRAVEVLADALREGYLLDRFRRGVLPRGEPPDRKLWAVRLSKDGVERILVVAPHASLPYLPGVARRVAESLPALGARVVLLASGKGNQALRDDAQALGIPVTEDDANAQILARLAEVSVRTGPSVLPPAADAEPATTRDPDPRDLVAAALTGPTAPAVDDLVPLIQKLRRTYLAFGPARSLLEGSLDEDADRRLAALLEAADRAADPDVRLLEGGTMAMVMASARPNGPSAAMLARPRYGGACMAELVAITRAAREAGWQVDRLLRGPTRRESMDQPALETLGRSMRELYRLFLFREDRKVEVWFLGPLLPEGRAGVPQLLLCTRPDAVLGSSAEWYAAIDGPPLQVWDGNAAPLLSRLSEQPRSA